MKTYKAYTHVPEISSTEYAGDLVVKMYASDSEVLQEAQLVYGDKLSHVRLGHHVIYAPEQEYEIPASQPYPSTKQDISSGGGDWIVTLGMIILVLVVIVVIIAGAWAFISPYIEYLFDKYDVIAQQSVHLTRAGVGNLQTLWFAALTGE